MHKTDLDHTNLHMDKKKKYHLVELREDCAIFMEVDADPRDFEKRIFIDR